MNTMEKRDWFFGYWPKQTNWTKLRLIINTDDIIWKLLLKKKLFYELRWNGSTEHEVKRNQSKNK